MRALPAALLLAISILSALPGHAAPQAYALEAEKSRVGFAYRLNGGPMLGSMPVKQADIRIDFADFSKSTIDVVLDVKRARGGVFYATEALRGRSVLHVARFPEIRFRATRITRRGNGAIVEGLVTIRGVTRPLALEARLFRRKGRPEGDLSQLTVLLTGALNRHDFAASGYRDIVGPKIDLRIIARIRRIGR